LFIVIAFSRFLSRHVFGNLDHSWDFVFLSSTVLFTILTNKNNTLLQGSRKLKDLANSTVIGASAGLISSVPLYYYFEIKGIVPALIIASITNYLVSHYYVTRFSIVKPIINFKETYVEGLSMFKLGMVMMIASLMGSIVIFYVNTYISSQGTISDVGLYGAGIAITSQFIGLVFTAMSLDYFPRLSSVSNDNFKVHNTVNQQSEITLLIMLPLLIAMILSAPLIIKILLTNEFLKLTTFIRIVAFGTIFQAISFTISYIPLAKGDSKTYFIWNALFSNAFGLIILVIGYKYFGLNGLAYSLVINHLITFLVFLFITNRLYSYKMSRMLYYFLVVSVIMISCVLFLVNVFPNIYGYTFGVCLLIFGILFSLYYINRLIDLKMIINSLFNKKKYKS
jgi:O-antigen/teichoic acid export membrane protein